MNPVQRHTQLALTLPLGMNALESLCDGQLLYTFNISVLEIVELAIHLLPNYHWACDNNRMDLYYEEAVYLFSELGMNDISGYADALVESLKRISAALGDWITPKLLSEYEQYSPSYQLIRHHPQSIIVGMDIH